MIDRLPVIGVVAFGKRELSPICCAQTRVKGAGGESVKVVAYVSNKVIVRIPSTDSFVTMTFTYAQCLVTDCNEHVNIIANKVK